MRARGQQSGALNVFSVSQLDCFSCFALSHSMAELEVRKLLRLAPLLVARKPAEAASAWRGGQWDC